MRIIFANRDRAVSGQWSVSEWNHRLRLPLEAWSVRRRLLVALLIAVGVFVVGVQGWISADMGGTETSRVALREAQRRLAEASRALTQLPALRRRAAALPAARLPEDWGSADDVRAVSQLAARTGVTLVALEPGVTTGTGLDVVRPVHLTAQTDFPHLMGFLRGLSSLPVLVVPDDVTIRPDGGALAIGGTLRVFSALSPLPAVGAEGSVEVPVGDIDTNAREDIGFHDPFSFQPLADGDGFEVALRLVGLIRDRTHGLALLETADGVATVEPGQHLGAERVTRIDVSGITLVNRGGMRTLALAEAS